jgi:hypothetical protein
MFGLPDRILNRKPSWGDAAASPFSVCGEQLWQELQEQQQKLKEAKDAELQAILAHTETTYETATLPYLLLCQSILIADLMEWMYTLLWFCLG